MSVVTVGILSDSPSQCLTGTVELHDATPPASSKRRCRPDVVKYIRKLTYNVTYCDYWVSRIPPKILRTISCLNCLTVGLDDKVGTVPPRRKIGRV